jgi:hypothetical protein
MRTVAALLGLVRASGVLRGRIAIWVETVRLIGA